MSSVAEAVSLTPLRRLAKLAPFAYLVALGIDIGFEGVPLQRDRGMLWLVLGMGAFTASRPGRWARLVVDWLPIVALLVIYDFLRGAADGSLLSAHIDPQIDADSWLFGGTIPTLWLQDHLYDPDTVHWYDVVAWATYLSHFFVPWGTAAVLWVKARDRFLQLRTRLLIVTGLAYVGYLTFPAMPPWMASDYGFIGPSDRLIGHIWGELGIYPAQSLWEKGDGLVNLVAAMPSLHAAYPVVLLLFFWGAGWWVRAGLALYSLMMGFTLVYGAEHWVIDILLGWAIALLAFGIVRVGQAVSANWRRTN